MEQRTAGYPDPVVTGRRAAPGKRWSASSTIAWSGPSRKNLGSTSTTTDAPAGAIRAKVRYRLDGKSRSETFVAQPGNTTGQGPAHRAAHADLIKRVDDYQLLLRAAHTYDWPADDRHRPIAGAQLPTATPPAPAVPVRTGSAKHTEPAELAGFALPTTAALTGTGPTVVVIGDVAELAAWYIARQKATVKKRGGSQRSGNTTGDYENHLDFFLTYAIYSADDPRRTALGLPAGAPLRLDDQHNGLNQQDLLAYIATRASTNLRTRGRNQRQMVAWSAEVLDEEQRAAAEGRDPVLPDAPDIRPEQASSRTIEAGSRTVRAALKEAYDRGLITYMPWNAIVADEVPAAAVTTYTTKRLPDRAQVDTIREAITTIHRTVRTTTGTRDVCDGARYSAMVWVAGRMGTRPEETIAIRDSWVFLDADPRIELHGAEVYETLDGRRGRRRSEVPLKHRNVGEIRVIRPDAEDRNEFVRVLTEHRNRFVRIRGIEANRNGSSIEQPADSYFFTNHAAGPVDLGNFGGWWHDTMAAVEAANPAPAFRGLQFRRLRAAAITDWLVTLGYTTEQAATKAGTGQPMIEKHYKGVLDSRPAPASIVRGAQAPVADWSSALGAMTPEQIAEIVTASQGELMRRFQQWPTPVQ